MISSMDVPFLGSKDPVTLPMTTAIDGIRSPAVKEAKKPIASITL